MKQKFSLRQQIEEIELELKMRANVYARAVANGRMKQSEADYRTERLGAVRGTLLWLQGNEAKIKQLLAGAQ